MAERYDVSEVSTERVLIPFDADLLAWLDQEATKRDRSRAWLVAHVVKLYRGQVDRARERRAQAAGLTVDLKKGRSPRSTKPLRAR